MYNNIGKRDILIFPKFDNIDVINNIRNKYDRLVNLIDPHITIVFPFKDEINNEDLFNKLTNILKNYKTFEVNFKGVNLSNDNYVLLNCTKGKEILIKLHNEIYNKILPTHLNTNIPYIPHITLGQADNLNDFKEFNDEFKTYISEIFVELIGENEESIILGSIKL